MAKMTEQQMLLALKDFDTPSITNVVATYPLNPLCLGLYNPWTENWYTDTSIRCIYPEMGAIVGHAVTCVYGLPDPNYTGRLSFMDVVDALDAAFYATFQNVQPCGKPVLLALDVSGSMDGSTIAGSCLTAREASAAMALVTAATESECEIIAFSAPAGGGRGVAVGSDLVFQAPGGRGGSGAREGGLHQVRRLRERAALRARRAVGAGARDSVS